MVRVSSEDDLSQGDRYVFAVLIVLATLGILVTKGQDMIDERLARWRTV